MTRSDEETVDAPPRCRNNPRHARRISYRRRCGYANALLEVWEEEMHAAGLSASEAAGVYGVAEISQWRHGCRRLAPFLAFLAGVLWLDAPHRLVGRYLLVCLRSDGLHLNHFVSSSDCHCKEESG
jgi:hypothetical protein